MLVIPSPKSHRLSLKSPVEALVKTTVRGAPPEVGVAVKSATAGVAISTKPSSSVEGIAPSLMDPSVNVRGVEVPALPIASRLIFSNSPFASMGCAPARATRISPAVPVLVAMLRYRR